MRTSRVEDVVPAPCLTVQLNMLSIAASWVAIMSDQTRRIGLRLRELRRLNSLTTRELATRSGLSASMISQIETGRTNASIASLQRIAATLGVPIGEFFMEQNDEPPTSDGQAKTAVVVKREHRKGLRLPASHVIYELMTPDLRGPFEFLWVELEPRHAPIPARAHPGYECAVVIQGVMQAVIGDEEFILELGDSITFDSGIPHRIENRGEETLIQLSAISPPSF
jgi:transcriptional regulator with XRE-family HTH domain